MGAVDEEAAEIDPEVFNQQVIRGINSILNKLTVEKFDQLYKKLIGEVGMCAENHIVVLTKQLFTKSTQHHFIEMYTDLCVRLHQHFEENPIIDDAAKTFKKVLLNQCQESFEEYLRPPPGFDELEGDEKYEALVKYKTSILGNIKFVGNLLVQKMLSSKIIFQCSEQLMEAKTDETLETLAVFLTAIGPMFDNKQWPRYEQLSVVFDRVKALVKDKGNSVSPRIKCLLKDVLDARAQNWMGRSKKNEPEGPMKISEVARQARREEAAQANQSFKPDRQPSRREAEPRVQVGDDEWSTINTRAKPGGNAWGAKRQAETTAPAPQTSGNAFSAFSALSKKTAPRSKEGEAAKQAKKEAKKAKEAALQKPAGSKDLDEWSSSLSGALKEFYASKDLDEAVERLDGLAQAHHEEALDKYMWAV